jgi:branched-subunit amino acid ABC-type transport system permease component
MSEPRRNEKEEEKRGEKKEEKGRSWDEKWQHDSLRMISIAVILIWGGLVAFAGTLNLFSYDWEKHGWAIFLPGTGVILVVKVIIRAMVPEFRRAIGASLIIGIILLAVGISDLIGWNWNYIWPFIIIAIGLVILLRGTLRHRK